MKKFALMGAAAMAAALLATPSAQAAGSPYFPHGEKSVHHWSKSSPVYFSDTTFWCNHGQPEWAAAVKVTGKPRSLHINESRSYFKSSEWDTQVIGNSWVVLRGHPGARINTPRDGSLGWGGSAHVRLVKGSLSWEANLAPTSSPKSCTGLPKTPPALGQIRPR